MESRIQFVKSLQSAATNANSSPRSIPENEVCANENGRLGAARKSLKIMVPANGFEPLTPRV
ncbi:MAG: hypothetical protein QOH96_3399 [Blastocatellia bacterium]|nr:hypothetical protein [Blastocatellia bacterium]